MMKNELRELLLAQKMEDAADLAAKETPETLAEVLNELSSSDEGLLIAFCRA